MCQKSTYSFPPRTVWVEHAAVLGCLGQSVTHIQQFHGEAEPASGSLNGDASGKDWKQGTLYLVTFDANPITLESAFSWLKTWVYSLL